MLSFYTSPIGIIEINYENDYIISIAFSNNNEKFSNALDPSFIKDFKNQLDEYFIGKRQEFNIKSLLHGTEFQEKVWHELAKIPYGQTRSYKEIAIAIGNPKASRAVGLANNKNPLALIIPCHRVIGASGKLVGYRGGISIKEYLLSLEQNNKSKRED